MEHVFGRTIFFLLIVLLTIFIAFLFSGFLDAHLLAIAIELSLCVNLYILDFSHRFLRFLASYLLHAIFAISGFFWWINRDLSIAHFLHIDSNPSSLRLSP